MSLIGRVDTLTGPAIAGWAADDADIGRQVAVEVIVNARLVAALPCVRFREDLRQAGIGDGCKAFEYDPSAHLKPGRNSLEVRFAGTGIAVPRGLGHWVTLREGRLPAWELGFVAALEAYHAFGPQDHVCGIGPWAGELERILRTAHVPFRKFTRLDAARVAAGLRLPEKANVVVCEMEPKSVPDLRSGLLAVRLPDTPDPAERIKAALRDFRPVVKCDSIVTGPGGAHGTFGFAEIGAAENPTVEAAPVLAHIHVPKCAGTSFRVLLERYFGPRHLRLYVDDTYFVYGEETLRSYLMQEPEIVSLSSHHLRSFPCWVAGREMLYVTFLRDPIEQFVSYMTHIRKLYATLTSKSLLEAVPPDAPHLTLREFARWLLTQDRDIPFRENHNVNFFARHSSPAATDRLEAAKTTLAGFFFVGISERMEESVARLRAKVQAAGLDFPPGPVPCENTSSEYRDGLSWIHPGDEVGSLLLRSVEKDRQLYNWAVARFDA